MPSDGSSALHDLSAYMASARGVAPPRGSTTDHVTAALREAILDGLLPPATWLREQDVAAALEVSRTPVREALRQLADEQLVDRSTNRGAVVRAMGLDEVLAVYVVRASLEGLAARTASTRRARGNHAHVPGTRRAYRRTHGPGARALRARQAGGEPMTEQVGLLGLGNMGAALAHRLVQRFDVAAFDPDARRCAEASAIGAHVLESVDAVAEAATTVVLSLPRPAISLECTTQLVRAWTEPGVIVETSTVTPTDA